MSLNIFKKIFLLLFIADFLFGTCPDSCPGCNSFYYPKLVPTANEITQALKKAEDAIAKKYKQDIIPLKKDNMLLEKEISKVKMRILLLQKRIDYNQKKILYLDAKNNEKLLNKERTK